MGETIPSWILLRPHYRSAMVNGQLHVLSAKTNSSNYTYDGIEISGERVAHDIEEKLEALKKEGQEITKLSMVEYSKCGGDGA